MEKLQEAKIAGKVDSGVISLLDFINSLEDFYTTSSCFGRISLLHDLGSKLESYWLGKWHRKVSLEEVMKSLEKKPKGKVVIFKYESSILHIVARELEGAKKILTLARDSGYKRVGVQGFRKERYLVEICDTERIDTPIMDHGKILIDKEYLKYLVNLANRKFANGEKKLLRLERNLRKELS